MALLRILFVLLIGLITLPFRLLLGRFLNRGNLVTLSADDPGLNAAKAEALATLPEFLKRLSAPGADLASAAVKAPLAVPQGTEHVWLTDISYESGEFIGKVDNDASPESGVKAGQVIRVAASSISDWKIVERGMLVGGFTIRYFVERMPARQRRALDAGLPFRIGPEAIPSAG
ncbi:MAG TPA: DUF2314 domain-containing protein [Thermoanaerobaculia bacterium]